MNGVSEDITMTELILTSKSTLDHIANYCLDRGITCRVSRIWADGAEPYAYQLSVPNSVEILMLLLTYSDSVDVYSR